jgi:hypothetical protein
MAYTPTNWQDGVTPVNATNLNKIETGLDGQDDRIVLLEGKPAIPTVVNGQWVKGAGGLPTWAAITEADVAGLVADLAAKELAANKGVVNGYAPLDASAKVPAGNLPAIAADANKEDKANKGVASGYASLDATTKVPLAQLPAMGADLSFDGDWVAGTYADGDVVVKDGIAYLCVGGPTTVAPDVSLWGLASTASSIGIALPASPVDGQEFVLVDSLTAPTYAWTFKYVAGITDAYKWVFIGGSSLVNSVPGVDSTTSTTYTNLGLGPVVTFPRAGIYELEYGTAFYQSGNGAQAMMAPSYNGGTPADADAGGGRLDSGATTTTTAASAWKKTVWTVAAATTAQLRYRVNANTLFVFGRQMMVIPVRVA